MTASHSGSRSIRARRLLVAGVVAIGFAIAPGAEAQDPSGVRPSTDAAGCTAARPDTVIGPLYGTLHLDYSTRAVPDGLFDRVMARLAVVLASDTLELTPVQMLDAIVITGPPTLRPAPRLDLDPWWPGHPALAGEVQFTVAPSGALTDPHARGRGDTSITGAIVRAINRAGALDQSRPSVPVKLRLRLSLDPDSTVTSSIPLVAARLITSRHQDRRMRARESRPPLPPPRSGQSRSTTVRVFVWYEVDERGRVIPRTIGATSAANPDESKRYDVFANDVMDSARHWKHDPAGVSDCAARWRVVVPVWFNVAY